MHNNSIILSPQSNLNEYYDVIDELEEQLELYERFSKWYSNNTTGIFLLIDNKIGPFISLVTFKSILTDFQAIFTEEEITTIYEKLENLSNKHNQKQQQQKQQQQEQEQQQQKQKQKQQKPKEGEKEEKTSPTAGALTSTAIVVDGIHLIGNIERFLKLIDKLRVKLNKQLLCYKSQQFIKLYAIYATFEHYPLFPFHLDLGLISAEISLEQIIKLINANFPYPFKDDQIMILTKFFPNQPIKDYTATISECGLVHRNDINKLIEIKYDINIGNVDCPLLNDIVLSSLFLHDELCIVGKDEE